MDRNIRKDSQEYNVIGGKNRLRDTFVDYSQANLGFTMIAQHASDQLKWRGKG